MKVRWLTASEITEQVNPALAAKGWAELNLESCRVLGGFSEDDQHLVEFFVLQLFPLLGPMLRVDNEARDNGDTSRELAVQMQSYLEKEEARGFLAIAESPVTQRLCRRFGMQPIEAPVYGFVRVAVETEVVP